LGRIKNTTVVTSLNGSLSVNIRFETDTETETRILMRVLCQALLAMAYVTLVARTAQSDDSNCFKYETAYGNADVGSCTSAGVASKGGFQGPKLCVSRLLS
jgi:hypothetical protein